jgi:hypothetical protein
MVAAATVTWPPQVDKTPWQVRQTRPLRPSSQGNGYLYSEQRLQNTCQKKNWVKMCNFLPDRAGNAGTNWNAGRSGFHSMQFALM